MRTTVETFVSEYTTTIQERNERIKAFNRMTSHELRNPMGTILFAAAALTTEKARSNPDRLDKVAATIRSNAERLSWLVDNLQRLARLGDPLDVPSQQQIDLAALASEVARQLEDMAAARGVTIKIEHDLPTLFADPAHLELILLNLVSNAIKYSDPEKPEAFVTIGKWTDTNTNVCIVCVRDNGLGIPEADQPAIFDRFFRGHAHLDQALGNSGTGLGLAIAVECVRGLGGTIRCESTVGQGTTFLVTLPCKPPESSDSDEVQLSPGAPRAA
jgi:signal transduction histidine kinase